MTKLPAFIIFALLLGSVTIPLDQDRMELETRLRLESGDAAHYCISSLGYDFGLKIEAWDGDYSGAYDGQGSFDPGFTNTITISKANGYSFDWESSPNAINAVVVQGGLQDNIFYYIPDRQAGTRLYPNFVDKTSQDQHISQIYFCWRETGEDGEDECYQEETAWAANGDTQGDLLYTTKRNPATYVAYAGEVKTVNVYAGQAQPAGVATFSAPVHGEVRINIKLHQGYIFYYDLDDQLEDDNLAVQVYEDAPSGSPDPGLFEWKKMIPVGRTTGSIIVPADNFYGVHIDLARKVTCQ